MSAAGTFLGAPGELGAPERWKRAPTVLWIASSLPAGAIVAYLVSSGLWYAAFALLLAVPMFVLLHRRPMAAVTLWLLITPFVSATESGAVRKVFWMIHRFLPVTSLAILLLSSLLGIGARRLAKLGWPEVAMAGYVIATLLSIAYRSSEPIATSFLLYDRVIAPMCLYLIVRLFGPGEQELRRLVPTVTVVLLVESVIGFVSWTAPGILPSAWLTHVGERTTGTFEDPSVFGIMMLFCGLLLLSSDLTRRSRGLGHVPWIVLFLLAMFMVFFTFSRANWLAGLIGLVGALIIYRRSLAWLLVMLVPIVMLLLASGVLSGQLRFAHERLVSEETALSRLPPAVAAVRMFEVEPIVGWGYDNFDLFSRDFEGRVGDIIYPEKVHASHNLFLTLLAEQGVVGIGLFLAPTFYWAVMSGAVLRRMPKDVFLGRQLLGVLWLTIAGFIVVNNFVVMHDTFGLGLWWVTLGLIGAIVQRHRPPRRSRSERTRLASDVSADRELQGSGRRWGS